jgi:hypothetical protein
MEGGMEEGERKLEGELSNSFCWLLAGGDKRKRERSSQRRVGTKA